MITIGEGAGENWWCLLLALPPPVIFDNHSAEEEQRFESDEEESLLSAGMKERRILGGKQPQNAVVGGARFGNLSSDRANKQLKSRGSSIINQSDK